MIVDGHWCSAPIPSGSELLAVNGQKTNSLVAAYALGLGARGAPARDLVARDWSVFSWLHQSEAPFHLEYKTFDTGDVQRAEHEGCTIESVMQGTADAQKKEPYSHRWIGDVCYLDFRSMSDGDRFSDYLATLFAAIQTRAASGLIVDLRENSGGNSALGDALIEYLTDRPYRQYTKRVWKVSTQYQDYLRSNGAGDDHLMLTGQPGSILTDAVPMRTPERKDLLFTGSVAVLIGPATASSAVSLADVVRTYDLGRLFGQPTGGTPNGFGEVYQTQLPNSDLLLQVSSALWVGASGDETDSSPVIPHEHVDDTTVPDDEVLDAALRWIDFNEAPTGSTV